MSGDVLCLSHLRWGFVYQRPNHLMARWARDHRVFFVEEPVFDAPSPRLEVQTTAGGVRVVVPHLPEGLDADARDDAHRELLQELVEREAITQPIVWYYTPLALGWVPDVRAAVTVYDCMDELSNFRGAPPALRERERELFALADVVFTGGQSLYEAKRDAHPRVHAFPSSVDGAHFRAAREPGPDPHDQAAIARPRVGFFGVIDERMDLDLVHDVAALLPNIQFVMLGPVVKIDPASLPRGPNLHWLGARTYEELPAYLGGWDAAIMPFARNESTQFISPTKVLEYLAAAKPVVSTSIRDVVQPYGDAGLVRIADTPTAFARALECALEEPADHEAREAMLATTSWDSTFARMRAHVDELRRRKHAHPSSQLHARSHEEVVPCSTI